MIQRSESSPSQPEPTSFHGFVVGVEIEEKVTLQEIVNKLADSLQFLEGVGRVDVEYLGQVDTSGTEEPAPTGIPGSFPELVHTPNTDVEC